MPAQGQYRKLAGRLRLSASAMEGYGKLRYNVCALLFVGLMVRVLGVHYHPSAVTVRLNVQRNDLGGARPRREFLLYGLPSFAASAAL